MFQDNLETIHSKEPKLGITERYTLPNGEKIWAETNKIPYRDETGEVIGVIVSIQDITDRKQGEEHLQAALKEKDVLLMEIHHRVKNNLQIINSLLSLRSDMVHDPQSLQVFQDCQNSVRAIALVHENIYQSYNLAQIDASEYVPNLVSHLLSLYNTHEPTITLNIDVAPLSLDLDSAIPFSLIITELVTNAFKHAFPAEKYPPGAEKQLWVNMWSEEDEASNQHYVLRVRDNGVGLPSGFAIQHTTSLGLRLVHLLTQQLSGEIHFTGDEGGTAFQLTFPGMYSRRG